MSSSKSQSWDGKLITALTPNDVVLGRGSGSSRRPGSQQFLSLVRMHKDEYRSCPWKEKDPMARDIVDHIQHTLGGRFVKLIDKKNGVWQEVDYETAVEKTKQALRERKNDYQPEQQQDFSQVQSMFKDNTGVPAFSHDQQQQLALLQQAQQQLPLPNHVLSGGIAPYQQAFLPTHQTLPIVSSAAGVYNPSSAVARAAQTQAYPDPMQQVRMVTDAFVRQMADIFQNFPQFNNPLAGGIGHTQQQYVDPLQDCYGHRDGTTVVAKGSLHNHGQANIDEPRLPRETDPGKDPSYAHTRTESGTKTRDDKADAKEQRPLKDTTKKPHAANREESKSDDSKTVDDESAALDFLMSTRQDDSETRFTREQEEQERARLSQDEKDEVLADIFGSLCEITPRAKRSKTRPVESLVGEMRIELLRLPVEHKLALLVAQEKSSPQEFSDQRLKLFLQREHMNASLAARRFTLYWEKRRELLGPDKFHLPMTQSGAFRDDHVILQSGIMGLLPNLDASDRPIMYLIPRHNTSNEYTSDSVQRLLWYISEVASQHAKAEKVISIVLILWQKGATMWDLHRTSTHMDVAIELERDVWPVKYSAVHICHEPSFVTQYLRPIAMARMDKRFRLRVVNHDHPEQDMARVLSGYGIPEDVLPTEMGGRFDLNHKEWLQSRRSFEQRTRARNSCLPELQNASTSGDYLCT